MARKRKHPSTRMATLAGQVLEGYLPSAAELRSLAACVLSMDVTPGPNEPRPLEQEAADGDQ